MIYDVNGEQCVGCRPGDILGVDEASQKFKVVFADTKERKLVPRIYVFLDHENPYRWCDRF